MNESNALPPRPPYCLSIFDGTVDDALGVIARESQRYACFEVWVDRIVGFRPSDWTRLRDRSRRPLIAVWDRGPDTNPQRGWDLRQRRALLEQLGPEDWVDLDTRTQADDWAWLDAHGCAARRIASAHDYRATPDEVELDAIESELRRRPAELVKISTHCESEADGLRLLARRLRWRELDGPGRGSIIFGMGRRGRATRIFAPLWGNALVYAPTGGAGSAPGQIPLSDLESIYRALGESPEDSAWFRER